VILCQLLGAVLGAYVLNKLNARDDLDEDAILPLGYTVLGENVTGSVGLLVEFMSSFVLVFVVFSCYDETSLQAGGPETVTVPFIVGLTLMACSLFAVRYVTNKWLKWMVFWTSGLTHFFNIFSETIIFFL